MCWREKRLGCGCAGRKGKSEDEGKMDGSRGGGNDDDDDSNKGEKCSWMPFSFFKQGKKKDEDVENGSFDTKSSTTIASPAYEKQATAGTPPVIQVQAATDRDRWSNVDSVMTWKPKDRAAMYWATVKGRCSSVFGKFKSKGKGKDEDIRNGSYAPEDCISGPEHSTCDDKDYMMSGARQVSLTELEEVDLADVRLS
jgi:hypothetical protein